MQRSEHFVLSELCSNANEESIHTTKSSKTEA